MQFTTVRSKEKDYDIYLMSEKLVHSQQEPEKSFSKLFGSGKNWFLAISSLTNTVAAIWREKKVDPCQPVGARKKFFQTIWKWKKLVPSYFEPDKHCCCYIWSPINGVHNSQEQGKRL